MVFNPCPKPPKREKKKPKPLMRTPLRRVAKKTRSTGINPFKPVYPKKESAMEEWERVKRTKLKPLYAQKGIECCELDSELVPHVCTRNWYTGFAHRHGRTWYKNRKHLLGAWEQTIMACQNGHDILDKVTRNHEQVFMKLRGAEHGVTATKTDPLK